MKRGKAMKSIGVMVSALLFGFAVMGCRPKVVPMRYDLEYDVTAEPANECEIRPGLYCAVADPNEEGLFNLIEPHGDSAYLIRSQSFDTGAWVEVKEGEQLLILRAKLFTEEERRAQLAVSKPTPRNGFFMVGADLAEGHHLVRGLAKKENRAAKSMPTPTLCRGTPYVLMKRVPVVLPTSMSPMESFSCLRTRRSISARPEWSLPILSGKCGGSGEPAVGG